MLGHFLNERQKRLREEVVDFVRWVPKRLILDMDRDKVIYPVEFLREAGKRNLLGLRFPKELGGRGLMWQDEIIALEEIGVLGSSLACLYSLVSIVGEAINKFGNEYQKENYLIPMLKGERYCAEALTEPRGGSDFFGCTTTARKEGDYFILNGQKRFVVGAEGADFFMVYAKTDETSVPHRSISVFLVDRESGVKTEYLYGLMGTRGGGAGRIVFKDVRVSEKNLVGRLNGGAEVFYQMMIPERMTTAAGAIGAAKSALSIAAKYSTKRKAFGKFIKEFEAISFKIADAITELDAANALIYATAVAIDRGEDSAYVRRLVSESKKFSTEVAWRVVNNAMQVMGGIGYTDIFPIERLLRDIRLMMIWTGTNEIMDLIIQHEYYKSAEFDKDRVREYEEDANEASRKDEIVFE
ncbi:MAG: acyl-CoA/acyl-ACP dehydrogenase [Deltaproteobacteria bacterium]|nr:acyl-CoA/acyl-ACP dehydrogenase [Deltaproteobacteria bacterium]